VRCAARLLLGLGVVLAVPALGAGQRRADPALVGAWHGGDGALAGIVFLDQPRRFFADRARVCVRPPCPSLRFAGAWGAHRNRLVLRTRQGRAIIARYEVGAGTLVLRRPRDGSVLASLTSAPTYCAAARDCERQDYVRPRCIGRDVCDAERTCRWQCGAETGCDGYLCVDGEQCEVAGGGPRCVSRENTCALVLCAADRPHCVAADGEVACLPPDRCHRDADCPERTSCVPEFVCVRSPCFAPLVCR
jgi:hypothetical protein